MDISALLALLRRRGWIIALGLVLGLGAGVTAYRQSTPVYRSQSSVLLNVPNAATTAEALQGIQISSQLLQSYAQVVSSRSLASQVKEQLGLEESVGAVNGRLSAQVQPQTLFILVRAQDEDPVRARSLANAATTALIERIKQFQAGRSADTALTATVVDPAASGSKIGPRRSFDLGVGGALGLVLGSLLALLVDALDRSVKTGAAAHALVGAPLLGLVPRFRRRSAIEAPLGRDPVGESYRALRTAVRFVNPEAPVRALTVTSAVEGEGKTTTAANLAIALAESGDSVLLVDADLRRGGLAPALGIEGAVGLSDVIVGAVALEDALQEWRELLTVLPAGTPPPNPSELLGSHPMEQLIATFASEFDVVILDAPPVLPVTDAVVLATLTDGLVVVVRAGRTSRTSVAELRRRLETVQADVLGVVLNDASARQLPYDDYRTLTGY